MGGGNRLVGVRAQVKPQPRQQCEIGVLRLGHALQGLRDESGSWIIEGGVPGFGYTHALGLVNE
jgi:hypothetical protein